MAVDRFLVEVGAVHTIVTAHEGELTEVIAKRAIADMGWKGGSSLVAVSRIGTPRRLTASTILSLVPYK